MFLFSTWYNTDDLLLSCAEEGVVFDLEELLTFTDSRAQSFLAVWDIMKRYQQLDLTESESIVTAALALMSAG